MKAVIVNEDHSLSWGEVDHPKIGDQEVLIKISATAINRADLMQRKGFYPPLRERVKSWVWNVQAKLWRWVQPALDSRSVIRFALCLLAEAIASTHLPMRVVCCQYRDGLSDEQGAALPEVFATAWLNLFIEAGLKAGDKAIVHAGASGVGTTAIQLCKAFGASSFVTVGSKDKLRDCIELGASGGFNRHDGSFLEAAKTFAGESGVDVILDPVGAGYLSDNLSFTWLWGAVGFDRFDGRY